MKLTPEAFYSLITQACEFFEPDNLGTLTKEEIQEYAAEQGVLVLIEIKESKK